MSNRYDVRQLTARAEEDWCVSLTQAKAAAKITTAAEDVDLNARLIECLDAVSGLASCRLLDETSTVSYEAFPTDGRLRIPLNYVTAVSAVKYYDENDSLATVAGSNYVTEVDELGICSVVFKLSYSVPSLTSERRTWKVFVELSSGSSPSPNIEAAVKMLFAHRYANRGEFAGGSPLNVPMGVVNLCASERQGFFGRFL